MSLIVLSEAEEEIRSAYFYLRQESPSIASRFLDEVHSSFIDIVERPLSFAKLETLSSNEPYRRAILSSFRYAIVFEIIPSGIVVVAVPHTSREPNYWLTRLGDR